MRLTLGQIADWLHAEGDFATDAEAAGFSIDSRTVGAGEVFFAIQGERFDGHNFVAAALDAGAIGAVVSRHWLAPDDLDPRRLMRVPEGDDCVLRALQILAREVRRAWKGRVIGVTGSAGKTTTKEAVAAVLSTQYCVLWSEGNLNNHVGLPLQLLRLEAAHEVAVLEMGMNHAGEIRALAAIAQPDWGVVSNVGPVHLEFFPEGIIGIAAAKRELIEALPGDGLAFLNADDGAVRGFAEGRRERSVLYGMSPDADVRVESVEELGPDGLRFRVVAQEAETDVRLHLIGRHNALNAAAAIAVGLESGIALSRCADALENLRSNSKRGEVSHWRGATIVNDSYNSNPRALDAMVDALLSIPAQRHIVVAGEMLELGPEAAALHAGCGRHMAERGIAAVVAVRGTARALADAARDAGTEATYLDTPREAGEWLRRELRAGDAVLLKASRGVRLETALEVLTD